VKSADQDIQNYNFACFLYGCETLSLTLREERKLRVFENMVLRRIFGLGRDEDGSPGGGMWVYGLDWAGPG